MSVDNVRCAGRFAPRILLMTIAIISGSGRASGQGMPAGMKMMDWSPTSFVLLEQSDFIAGEKGRPIDYEGIGWYGGAYNRLWVRSEGDVLTTSRAGSADAEVLYGRLVSPYWDALIGVRVAGRWGEQSGGRTVASATRTMLAIGFQGLAPLRFDFAPTLFVSRDGNLSGRLDASYELLFTQRLIAEPSLDVNASARAIPALGIGSGVNDVALAARLRYEIRRQFGPYVGVVWTRRTGSTASAARADGRGASDAAIVVGIRAWH